MNGKENMWFRNLDPTDVERLTIHDSPFNSTCSKRLKAELISPGVMRWEVVITATLDLFVEPFPFCLFSHCTVRGIRAFLHSFSRCSARKPLNTFFFHFVLPGHFLGLQFPFLYLCTKLEDILKKTIHPTRPTTSSDLVIQYHQSGVRLWPKSACE